LIRHEINLCFLGVEVKYMDSLLAVYDLLMLYIRLSSLLALVQEHKTLRQYIVPIFNIQNSKFKRKLKEFPDILKCIDTITRCLTRKEIYLSWHLFLKNVSNVLELVFQTLEPRYLRTSEALVLFRLAQEYKRKIENDEPAYLPKIGSLERFCELLENIFKNNSIFPELRIIAGQVLLDILEFKFF